jgi:hypothetical protein
VPFIDLKAAAVGFKASALALSPVMELVVPEGVDMPSLIGKWSYNGVTHA